MLSACIRLLYIEQPSYDSSIHLFVKCNDVLLLGLILMFNQSDVQYLNSLIKKLYSVHTKYNRLLWLTLHLYIVIYCMLASLEFISMWHSKEYSNIHTRIVLIRTSTFKTELQDFVDPRFSKTLVLVKSRVQKCRSNLPKPN